MAPESLNRKISTNMPQSETPPKSQYPNGKSPGQWKLSTVFLLVTLCAIAASGYSRGGTRGLWHSLFSFWFVVLGFCLILFGAKSRTSEDYFLLAAGFVLLGAGLYALMTYQYW